MLVCDAPEVDSLFGLYPGTEAMEREAFDLFGILFTNHPDLTRILMPEEWEGHPLRKDYGSGEALVRAVDEVSLSLGAGETLRRARISLQAGGGHKMLSITGEARRPTASCLRTPRESRPRRVDMTSRKLDTQLFKRYYHGIGIQ